MANLFIPFKYAKLVPYMCSERGGLEGVCKHLYRYICSIKLISEELIAYSPTHEQLTPGKEVTNCRLTSPFSPPNVVKSKGGSFPLSSSYDNKRKRKQEERKIRRFRLH